MLLVLQNAEFTKVIVKIPFDKTDKQFRQIVVLLENHHFTTVGQSEQNRRH